VVDFIDTGNTAFFVGNPLEGPISRGWQAVRSGYQQSYPQKFGISYKPLKNQAFSPHSASEAGISPHSPSTNGPGPALLTPAPR
jgi:hypothetical protein